MTRRWISLVTLLALMLAPAPMRAADEAERAAALIGMARVKRDGHDLVGARRYFEDARRLRPFGAAELVEYFWVIVEVDPVSAVAVGRDVLRAAPGSHDVRDRLVALAIDRNDEAAVATLASDGQRLQPGLKNSSGGPGNWQPEPAASRASAAMQVSAIAEYPAQSGQPPCPEVG